MRGERVSVQGEQDRRANLIAAASREFAEKGLYGARVDGIAKRLNSSKRAIYYYFGSKEGLYSEVQSAFYRRLREAERAFAATLESTTALGAIEAVAGFNFDWHLANEDGVRLAVQENIHQGRHLADMACYESAQTDSVALLSRLLRRGVEDGTVRQGVDPLNLYLSITALCFCNVSNRYTTSVIFHCDTGDREWSGQRREHIIEMVRLAIAAQP